LKKLGISADGRWLFKGDKKIGDATMQHVFRKFGLAWAAHGRISSTYVQYLEGKYTELRISELIAAQ